MAGTDYTAFIGFRQFIDTHLLACPSKPSGSNEAPSYTLAVSCLHIITVALSGGLLEKAMRLLAREYLLSIMPRLVEWVRYIVKHGVLTNYTGLESLPEFAVTHDLSRMLKDPELRSHILDIVVPEEDSPGVQTYFVSETLLSVLLHHVSFPAQQWSSTIYESWYHSLTYLNHDVALADKPAWKEEIIEGLKRRPVKVVAVFNLLTTSSVLAIQSSSTRKDFNNALTKCLMTYAVLPFLQDDIFRHEFLRTQHVRWICGTMRSIIRSTVLASRTPGGTADSLVGEYEIRVTAEKCLFMIGIRLSHLMLEEGWWIIKEVFEHDVLVDLFRYMRSSFRRSHTVTEHCTVSGPLGLTDILTHPTWLSFSTKVRAMEASRQEYKAHMPCICQNVVSLSNVFIPTQCWQCPNRNVKSRRLLRCSACQTSFYCSRSCQREDWSSHRDKCAIIVSEISGRRNRHRTLRDESFTSFLLHKEALKDFTSPSDSDDVDSVTVHSIDLSKAENRRTLVPLSECVELEGFESIMARVKAGEKGIILRSIVPNAWEAEERVRFVPQAGLRGGLIYLSTQM
ncbi:hypothetical protein CPB85DRAFT_1295700 [Mucidula mucida]|nr:hypothetical protein CPB85DRAFT_1295700 [Mucidula mucida]